MIDNIFRRLSALYSPSEVEVWLQSPHPQLDNETALSAMIRGRANEVTAILDRLEGGAYL